MPRMRDLTIFVLTTTETEGHAHAHELACMHEHISIAWLVLSIGVATMTDKKHYFCSLVPRPHHARQERVWGHWRPCLDRAHHHVTARAPIQNYANNHMIAELAEPRISANVPRPFPPLGVGSGDETTYTNI